VARVWSPSLLVMDRIIARWSASLAICEKCSLIWMPGTLVLIGLNGPPWACPGLRSKVSSWLGPPLIHSRMQERLRCGFLAASAASTFSQPDAEGPTTPAAASLSQSRREIWSRSMESPWSVVQQELRAVEQHPEHVGQGLL